MGAAYTGKSLGGHPTGQATPAQLVGVAPSWGVAPSGSHSVEAGGQDWVDEPVKCQGVIKSSGWPCDQAPRPNSLFCFGHRSYDSVGE